MRWGGSILGEGHCFLNLGASPEKSFERKGRRGEEREKQRERETERNREREKHRHTQATDMGAEWQGDSIHWGL